MSPLRFLTPAQLAICAVLFFLPWVEVQCGMPNLGKLGGNIGDPNAAPPKITSKDLTYSPLLTQSGFQAAMGEYTMAESVRAMMDQGKQMAKQMGGDVKEEKQEKVRSAPVLWLFPAAAIAGVVLGLVLPSGGARKFILVLCCGLALASVGTQAVIGFPVTEDVKKDPELAGGGKGGKNDDLGGLKPDDIIRTVYKFPFYLALLFAVGGLVTALIEPTGSPKAKRSRYDFGDDEVAEAEPDERDGPREPRGER